MSDIFLNFSSLANTVTKIIQFGSANFTFTNNRNAVNVGGMKREYTLYTNTVGNGEL